MHPHGRMPAFDVARADELFAWVFGNSVLCDPVTAEGKYRRARHGVLVADSNRHPHGIIDFLKGVWHRRQIGAETI
jgi:hypothetical protein